MAMKETEAHKVLSSESRFKILRLLLREHMSADNVATKLDLGAMTVRHHLHSLERVGFVESYEVKGQVGKPKLLFRVASKPTLVIFPTRHYLQLLEAIFASLRAILGNDRLEELLWNTGRNVGKHVMDTLKSQNEVESWDLETFRQVYVEKFLTEAGAEPEVTGASDRKLVYRIHNCPFLELVAKDPAICEVMEDGKQQGILEASGVAQQRARCVAHGDPYCEFVCENRHLNSR